MHIVVDRCFASLLPHFSHATNESSIPRTSPLKSLMICFFSVLTLSQSMYQSLCSTTSLSFSSALIESEETKRTATKGPGVSFRSLMASISLSAISLPKHFVGFNPGKCVLELPHLEMIAFLTSDKMKESTTPSRTPDIVMRQGEEETRNKISKFIVSLNSTIRREVVQSPAQGNQTPVISRGVISKG